MEPEITTNYLLSRNEIDDINLVSADGPIPLTDIFPNGVVFEMRGDEIVGVRHPVCGDDPEMMARIEAGLKRMNALLLSENLL